MIDYEIDYEIIDGICSYCGRYADWIPLEGVDVNGNPLDGYSTCIACEAYNEALEMRIDDDRPFSSITSTDEDNEN